MLPAPLRHRIPTLVKRCISRGLLPFEWGARDHYRDFERSWPHGVPRTLNQKIQYKIIHDRRPVVRTYSDKLAVRDYVQSQLPELRLPRLLGVGDTVDDVLASVPPRGPWVMKATHGAGMVLLCKPGEEVSPEVIARHARDWFATDYSVRHWEWQYSRLPRRVFFEEYLGTEADPPADYKFFTIHQQVHLITVDQGRFGHHTRDLFRPDWTPLRIRKGRTPSSAVPPPRPYQLDDLIEIAERLGADHDFIRVDLYLVGGEIYFGELTHSPAAGKTPFEDPAIDVELGDYWTLPRDYRQLEAGAPRRSPQAPVAGAAVS